MWNPPTRALVDKAVRSILARQLPDGGFNIYPKGPADVSATVKAYFALKLAGVPADDPRMARARERILALGGIQAANSYVKINLSLFGLYPREHCPSVPPEMMLLPGEFHLPDVVVDAGHRGAALDRAALDPGAPGAGGLHAGGAVPARRAAVGTGAARSLLSWRNLFLVHRPAAEVLGAARLAGAAPEGASARREQWMLERTQHSDGLGAIYPPMMYVIMALDVLGYAADHPGPSWRRSAQFERPAGGRRRAVLLPALLLAGVGHGDRRVSRSANRGTRPRRRCGGAADWLLAKEVRRKGDWSVKRPDTEPSGWYFEFANEFYPDIDDTAMVLLALQARAGVERRSAGGLRSAAPSDWLLGMQSRDGGWAAFDVDNNWELAEQRAVRRPQRDARPDLPGHHRPRAGSAVRAAASTGDASGRPARRRVPAAARRSRTEAGTGAGA